MGAICLLYEFTNNIYDDDQESKKAANSKNFDMLVSQLIPPFGFVYTN